MARVVQLFASKSSAADERAPFTVAMRVAISDVLGSINLVVPSIRELETHLDNLDWVISQLGDSKKRQFLEDLAKVQRHSLVEATQELARQVRKLQQPLLF